VCYSLGITAVDPVGMDLLFERFPLRGARRMARHRSRSAERRSARTGDSSTSTTSTAGLGAAMTANVITYRGRSAGARGREVLGFDPLQIDRLAKIMNQFEFTDPADTLPRQLSRSASISIPIASGCSRGCGARCSICRAISAALRRDGDLPGPARRVVPLENASMPDRVVVQWDKDDCADMGIVKVDLLGLGMMAAMQDAMALVNGEGEVKVRVRVRPSATDGYAGSDFRRQPLERERTSRSDFRLQTSTCASARSIWRTAAERSRGLQDAVRGRHDRRLPGRIARADGDAAAAQAERFYDSSSRSRSSGRADRRADGASVSERARGREAGGYPHPSLEPILARTLGVPLFQEQLLRMAMVAAGFTGGAGRGAAARVRVQAIRKRDEADRSAAARRDGAAGHHGRRGGRDHHVDHLVRALRLSRVARGELRAAGYASAYLKAHYPAAFYTALLNNQPMGFYHPSTLVKDAQRRGVRFHPIDVQISDVGLHRRERRRDPPRVR
jgi:error-prone DNA polymerase